MGGGALAALAPGGLAGAALPRPCRARVLLDDPAFVYGRPCFSPDGSEVLFMRAPAGGDPAAVQDSDAAPWSLWTVPVSGGAPRPFLDDPEIVATRPDWSSTSGRVAFTGFVGGVPGLWRIEGDGSGVARVAVDAGPDARLLYPSWYPDGRRVAVTDYAGARVLSVDVVDGAWRALTDPARVRPGMGAVCPPAPGTEGDDAVVFAGQPPGGAWDVRRNALWLVRRGAGAARLEDAPGRTPACAPDGSRVAFASVRPRPAPIAAVRARRLPGGVSAIHVARLRPDVPRLEEVVDVSPYGWSAIHPKWSPDGRRLTCTLTRADGRRRALVVLELEGCVGP